VTVRANIDAGLLKITTGKNFVFTASDSLFNIGGDPGSGDSSTSAWAAVQAAAEAAKTNFSGTGNAALTALVNQAIAAGSASNIIAANSVVVIAQELNVNGILQSGVPDYTVTVPVTATQAGGEIDFANQAHNLYLTNPSAAQALVNAHGLQTDDFNLFRLKGNAAATATDPNTGLTYQSSATGDNIPVYYDASFVDSTSGVHGRLVVNAVKVQGGFMSLTGRILSTGNGQLRVMDGFGRINVNNQTTLPLVLNKLDTSDGIDTLLFGDKK